MEEIINYYLDGMSIPQVSEKLGFSRSTVRLRLKERGLLRTRAEGVKMAAREGRLGSGFRGKKRVFTESHRENISKAKLAVGEKFSKGTSLKPSGYIEYTRGPNKGRSVHVVAMEEKIGRKLKTGECVHHIDGSRENNKIENLALMKLSDHARLHRMQEIEEGKIRKRKKDGKFC